MASFFIISVMYCFDYYQFWYNIIWLINYFLFTIFYYYYYDYYYYHRIEKVAAGMDLLEI